MPQEAEYVPALDEGTPDGLRIGESSKRIGGVTITTTTYKLLSSQEIRGRIDGMMEDKIKVRNKSKDNKDLADIPDDIIKTVELHDDGKVTFKMDEREYGTKINLGDPAVKERISQTARCAVFLGNVADTLIFLYNKVLKGEFDGIVDAAKKMKERKKNFKPVLPAGLVEAIEKEKAKMMEKKKAMAMKEEPKKVEKKDYRKDWGF